MKREVGLGIANLVPIMFSAAGNRVTSQAKFKEDLTKGLDAERIRYLARGNTLLMSKVDLNEAPEHVAVLDPQKA